MELNKENLIEQSENTLSEGAVDIVKIANIFNVKVYEYPFEDDVSGAVTKVEDGQISIFVNESDTINRQRFSIAHELAHVVLHSDVLSVKGVLNRKSHTERDNKEELEANLLAEEIIMPTKLVLSYLKENFGVNAEGKINSEIVSSISDHFKVSDLVSIIRLRNLKFNVPYIYYA